MSKDSRAGGKFCGSHTTLIPAAATIADIANKSDAVTKIALGYISAGLSSAKGLKRIKIVDDGACILLKIRDNTSHQEVHVYAKDTDAAKAEIAQGARKAGFGVTCA